MTVPPNTLASLSIWFTVWLSSRYNKRAPFIIAAAFIAIIGAHSQPVSCFTSDIMVNVGYIVLLTTKTREF